MILKIRRALNKISNKSMRRRAYSGISFALISVLTFTSSPVHAEESSDQTALTVNTWNMSKSKGDSDLSAAQAVIAALLLDQSESKYPAFKSKTSPKAKKIVTAWLKAKKSKASDSVAAKLSGFTSANAKAGDIYFLKQGVSAWLASKKAGKSDGEASLAFTRSVWEATITYAAILMTNDATVQKIKKEVQDWNTANGQ
jgi:hypothetical protein